MRLHPELGAKRIQRAKRAVGGSSGCEEGRGWLKGREDFTQILPDVEGQATGSRRVSIFPAAVQHVAHHLEKLLHTERLGLVTVEAGSHNL